MSGQQWTTWLICRKAIVNFKDSFDSTPYVEQPTPDVHERSQLAVSESQDMPSGNVKLTAPSDKSRKSESDCGLPASLFLTEGGLSPKGVNILA